jgi:hypothetical protein
VHIAADTDHQRDASAQPLLEAAATQERRL